MLADRSIGKGSYGETRFLPAVYFAFTALLFGQGTAGSSSVTGRVTDPSGAVIGAADVSLTDTSTAISQTTHSNSAGLYIFNNVTPGKYDISVSKTGFSRAAVHSQDVLVGTATTVNITLEVGAVSEVVEVKTAAGAELQTLNATMGATIPSEGLLEMPSINRDVSSLLFVQATAAPAFGGAESNITSGQIAGNMADQNTYMLDGGNSTSDLDGDNGTYVGSRSGVIPTPVESVEEIRVNTNNMTADFNSSNGGQMIVSTKRGTNQFHGSAYDFFQSDVMAANDWFNNFHDLGKPKSHYNRFGGSFRRTGSAEFPGREDLHLHELRRRALSALRALRENSPFRLPAAGHREIPRCRGQYHLVQSRYLHGVRGNWRPALRPARSGHQSGGEPGLEQVFA